jgi:hypothetical protein
MPFVAAIPTSRFRANRSEARQAQCPIRDAKRGPENKKRRIEEPAPNVRSRFVEAALPMDAARH